MPAFKRLIATVFFFFKPTDAQNCTFSKPTIYRVKIFKWENLPSWL